MPRAKTFCNLPRLLLTCALGAAALLWTTAVWADHSLGNPCIGCHMLRSTKVESGTRNVSAYRLNYPLYKDYWYCGNPFQGGQPLDCSYCHDVGDIGVEIGRDQGGTADGQTSPSSAHPVDVLGPVVSYGESRRIQCNDCHNADVSPVLLCEKDATDGYPNHRNLSGITADTGTNLRTGAAAHLKMEYGPTAGSDWTMTDNILCFDCHRPGGRSELDVRTDYARVNGGHNVLGIGSLEGKKLPCYNCHDPHAATADPDQSIQGNKALIINGTVRPANPYLTSYTEEGQDPPQGYDGTNDYVVCYGCHSGYKVEGFTLKDVLTADGFNPRFPFHANAHDGLAATSNCLQNAGGCHQGPHNTDVHRCLDCHSTSKTLATAHPKLRNPESSGFVGHVDASFAGIGGVTEGNIRSQHDIPYTDGPDDDMSLPEKNGCLSCHGVLPDDAVSGGVAFLRAGGSAYGRSQPLSEAWSDREALKAYDDFCLACHGGTYPKFGDFPAPNVGRYFALAGHGRTTSFSLPSSNGAPKIPCLECHLYHGSSAYKLLPGDSLVGQARVVKGFAYAPQTTGTVFPIGDNTDSRKIDYTDYTDKGGSPDSPTWYNSRLSGRTRNDLRSGYLSNYTVNWSTNRGDTPRNPAGIWTPFGTSGDVRPNTQNSNRSLDCNQDAADARDTTTPKIGFCNACHLYSNSTDGTASAYGRIYSHEGHVDGTWGGITCEDFPLGSKRNFFKDCAECHDPHGSGSSTNAHFFMVRGKIKHGKTENLTDAQSSSNWTEVNFYVSGANPVPPYDPDKTSNSEHLCNLCHSGLLWSNLDPAQDTADHALGQRCTRCHPHSESP